MQKAGSPGQLLNFLQYDRENIGVSVRHLSDSGRRYHYVCWQSPQLNFVAENKGGHVSLTSVL